MRRLRRPRGTQNDCCLKMDSTLSSSRVRPIRSNETSFLETVRVPRARNLSLARLRLFRGLCYPASHDTNLLRQKLVKHSPLKYSSAKAAQQAATRHPKPDKCTRRAFRVLVIQAYGRPVQTTESCRVGCASRILKRSRSLRLQRLLSYPGSIRRHIRGKLRYLYPPHYLSESAFLRSQYHHIVRDTGLDLERRRQPSFPLCKPHDSKSSIVSSARVTRRLLGVICLSWRESICFAHRQTDHSLHFVGSNTSWIAKVDLVMPPRGGVVHFVSLPICERLHLLDGCRFRVI